MSPTAGPEAVNARLADPAAQSAEQRRCAGWTSTRTSPPAPRSPTSWPRSTRWSRRVEAFTALFQDSRLCGVAASVGARVVVHGETVAAALVQAERAMYESKRRRCADAGGDSRGTGSGMGAGKLPAPRPSLTWSTDVVQPA